MLIGMISLSLGVSFSASAALTVTNNLPANTLANVVSAAFSVEGICWNPTILSGQTKQKQMPAICNHRNKLELTVLGNGYEQEVSHWGMDPNGSAVVRCSDGKYTATFCNAQNSCFTMVYSNGGGLLPTTCGTPVTKP